MKKGKTTLKKREAKNTNDPTNESKEYTQSRIIKGKTSLGKNKKKAEKIEQPQKNNTKFLVEQIILTYFTSRWHNKILDMKNRISSRTNQKEKNIRTLVRVLNRAVNYHTYLYLMELFDNMSNLPTREGVEHDPNYGKIFLVKNDNSQNVVEIEIEKEIIINPKSNLRDKGNNIKDYYNDEDYDGLAIYMYRNDGKPINKVEIEKDIDRLIDEYPDKDIDVERILKSKRLQYKLKHPRFSPFTKKDNLDSFVRYLYTYKPDKDKEKKEHIIVIKNKTYAYY
jgi:hypothetical protein